MGHSSEGLPAKDWVLDWPMTRNCKSEQNGLFPHILDGEVHPKCLGLLLAGSSCCRKRFAHRLSNSRWHPRRATLQGSSCGQEISSADEWRCFVALNPLSSLLQAEASAAVNEYWQYYTTALKRRDYTGLCYLQCFPSLVLQLTFLIAVWEAADDPKSQDG